MRSTEKSRVYLDWNSSAVPRAAALEALARVAAMTGNPSSTHSEGRAVRGLLDEARQQVANFMGCDFGEVVFTSGGTEANNLALALLIGDEPVGQLSAPQTLHPSLARTIEKLKNSGWQARILEVNTEGLVTGSAEPDEVVAMELVNHETGAIQDLRRFSGCEKLHCDAVQGFGRVPIICSELPAATISLSGHKLGAVKGIGALYVKKGVAQGSLLLGAGQERGLRPGTENLASICSLAAACREAGEEREREATRQRELVDELLKGILEIAPKALQNGPADPSRRAPNTLNVSFSPLGSDMLVAALDLEGVAVSAGSACTSGAVEPSTVLLAMGLGDERARSALRFSVGRETEAEDIARCLSALKTVLGRMDY